MQDNINHDVAWLLAVMHTALPIIRDLQDRVDALERELHPADHGPLPEPDRGPRVGG